MSKRKTHKRLHVTVRAENYDRLMKVCAYLDVKPSWMVDALLESHPNGMLVLLARYARRIRKLPIVENLM